MISQLPLNIQLNDIATFENYYSTDNEAVVIHIKNMFASHNQPFIYLWGQEGVGKTHLLQACCHFAQHLELSACYLPLGDHGQWQPELLDNFDQFDLVCLDDIEQIAAKPTWERACFNLFNQLRAADKRLLISAKHLPQQLGLKLEDLISRLTWGLSLRLQPLTDEAKLAALQLRAKNRGLGLSDEVARFLLLRCPRDMQSLFATLEKLDQASLAAKRRLTIPFVKEILRL